MVFLAVLSWLFVCLDLDDTRNLEWEVPAIPILCTQHVERQRKYEKKTGHLFSHSLIIRSVQLNPFFFKNDDLFFLLNVCSLSFSIISLKNIYFENGKIEILTLLLKLSLSWDCIVSNASRRYLLKRGC